MSKIPDKINARDGVSAEQWQEYVKWQKTMTEQVNDGGQWVLPAAGIFVSLKHKDKTYDVHFGNPSYGKPIEEHSDAEQRMHRIFMRAVTRMRVDVMPAMIAIFGELGWSPNMMYNVDKKIGLAIEGAMRHEAEAIKIGGIVKVSDKEAKGMHVFWQSVDAGLMKSAGTAAELFTTAYSDQGRKAKLIKF